MEQMRLISQLSSRAHVTAHVIAEAAIHNYGRDLHRILTLPVYCLGLCQNMGILYRYALSTEAAAHVTPPV